MTKPLRGRATLLRYWGFQLPGTLGVAALLAVLVEYFDLSPRLAAGFLLAWFLKDLALYPFVRRAYESRGDGGAGALLGRVATAHERLAPEGWVRLGAERWRARADGAPIEAGTAVRVTAVRGLTLLVEPAPDAERG